MVRYRGVEDYLRFPLWYMIALYDTGIVSRMVRADICFVLYFFEGEKTDTNLLFCDCVNCDISPFWHEKWLIVFLFICNCSSQTQFVTQFSYCFELNSEWIISFEFVAHANVSHM